MNRFAVAQQVPTHEPSNPLWQPSSARACRKRTWRLERSPLHRSIERQLSRVFRSCVPFGRNWVAKLAAVAHLARRTGGL